MYVEFLNLSDVAYCISSNQTTLWSFECLYAKFCEIGDGYLILSHVLAMAECISFGLIGILYGMVFGETGTLFGNFLVEMGWKMYMNIHEGKCEACVINLCRWLKCVYICG